jgi:hypothetical protein
MGTFLPARYIVCLYVVTWTDNCYMCVDCMYITMWFSGQ